MSSDSNAELVATYESERIAAYACYAIAALVCYEHLITFEYEVEFLQKRRRSAATWIFMLNRYILLAFALQSVAPYSSQTCGDALAMNFIDFATVTMQDIPAHAFATLRSVALLQIRSWKPLTLAILITSSLVFVVMDAYEQFTQTWAYVDDPVLRSSCFQIGFSVSTSIIQRLFVASGVYGIASAGIALFITLYRTGRQVQQASSLRLATTLSEVLLRDGSLFFLLALVIDVFGSVPATDGVFTKSAAGIILAQLFTVLPLILLSRFVINLRQVDSPSSIPSDNRHPSRFSIPNFRMPTLDEVIDNLGEPMDFTERRADDDVYEEGWDSEDSGVRIDSADEQIEFRHLDMAGQPGATRPDIDIEVAGPSGGGDGSGSSGANVGVMVIAGFEVQPELRLSPTLTV